MTASRNDNIVSNIWLLLDYNAARLQFQATHHFKAWLQLPTRGSLSVASEEHLGTDQSHLRSSRGRNPEGPSALEMDLIHPSTNHRRQTAKKKKGRDEKTVARGKGARPGRRRPGPPISGSPQSAIPVSSASKAALRREARVRLVRSRISQRTSPTPVVQPHPSTLIKSDSCSPTAQSEAGLLSAWPPPCASTASEPMDPQWEEIPDQPRFAVGAGQTSCTLPTEHALLHSGHASAGPMHRRPASGRHTQTRLLSWQAVSCRCCCEAPVAPRRRQMG